MKIVCNRYPDKLFEVSEDARCIASNMHPRDMHKCPVWDDDVDICNADCPYFMEHSDDDMQDDEET